MSTAFPFAPERYERELRAILAEVRAPVDWDDALLAAIVRRHPKDGCGFFSKSELIRGYRFLRRKYDWGGDEEELVARLRMKPVRTLSGVAPVTVLTKPYPCPGRCIFCPSDVRMPKSYLSSEPGAQRAAEHQFDPYRQTLSRLVSLHHTGHRLDKVELIVLGGTWSFYPEIYQRWFVKRCFDALEDFGSGIRSEALGEVGFAVDYRDCDDRVDGSTHGKAYNTVVRRFLASRGGAAPGQGERAEWSELAEAQRRNEAGRVRCVGLVLETRPDHLDAEEIVRLRRLGATKVQIGIQSLSDRVLELNRRGHDVAATRRAMALLRRGGFKIHAHWMPNLYGSSPADDVADYRRLFDDPDFRPDELKLYPCSLIESAELMRHWRRGEWRPYAREELLEVLTECLLATPEYCRLTRVIRDIPGTDIVDGNRLTNFRQLAEQEVARRGERLREIRAREIRKEAVGADELRLRSATYDAAGGREVFLQMVTADDRLAAFLRLRLPAGDSLAETPEGLAELRTSAIVREVHVYGSVVGLGERRTEASQHAGLGRRLIDVAAGLAATAGYRDLAVISSVGTRRYYRRLGFRDGNLYQHCPLADAEQPRV